VKTTAEEGAVEVTLRIRPLSQKLRAGSVSSDSSSRLSDGSSEASRWVGRRAIERDKQTRETIYGREGLGWTQSDGESHAFFLPSSSFIYTYHTYIYIYIYFALLCVLTDDGISPFYVC
jgi:hypothetical protein